MLTPFWSLRFGKAPFRMSRPRLVAASAAVVALMMCAAAQAQQQVRWAVPAGNWNVANNWDSAAVPNNVGGVQAAIIDNGGSATLDTAVPTVGQVWVGDGAGKGTLNVAAGANLTIASEDTTQSGYLVVGRTGGFTGAHADSLLSMTGGTIVADQIEVGQTFGGLDSTNAQMVVGGTSTVTVHNYIRVGHGDGGSDGASGILTVKDNAVLTNDGTGTRPFVDDFSAFGFNGVNGGNTGTLNLQNNAIFNSKRPVRFGWVEEGKGFLNVSGNAQLNIDSGELSAAAIMFGDFNNGSNATPNNRPVGIATQSGGVVNVGTDAARPRWAAIGGSGRGEYTLSGGKLNILIRDGLNIGDADQNGWAGEGLLTITGGTLNATELWVGKLGRATGTINQSGGSVNVGVATADGNFVDRIDTLGEQLALGIFDGRLNIGGVAAGTAAVGNYTISAGSLHVLGAHVGNEGSGTLTQNGGTVTANQGIVVARADNGGPTPVPSTGIYHLNGGMLTTSSLTGGTGNSTVNFNGGVLRASGDNPTFLAGLTTANVALGGAKIDSNGFAIASAQVLAGGGGVTKLGLGTLTLSGANTYQGATTVSAGTLSLGSAFLANAADVTISPGATLDLAFAGNDIIDSLMLGSQVAGVGIWGATGSGAQFETSFITGTGRLQVTTAPVFLPGDFDKNNVVNAADLAQWRGDVGIDNGSDADNDGDTDGNDFVLWQRNLGAGAPAAAVPEPAAVCILGVALVALAGSRRRGRS
ncbi:MAG TPA: autotransporter-associated beta strand repeat-containing protein [Lacipirellulaceae bacterium]|nr:autotransporter-associated beta strand repeat-containing protein [Lacipirellulaceae bacterium]